MKPGSHFFKYRAINTGTHQYQEGIYYHKPSGKYKVQIPDYWSPKTKQGWTKQKPVGLYETIPEATMAWLLVKEQQINRYVQENQGDDETISKLVAFKNYLWSKVYQALEPTGINEDGKTSLFFIATNGSHIYVTHHTDPVAIAIKLPSAYRVYYDIGTTLETSLLAYINDKQIDDTQWYRVPIVLLEDLFPLLQVTSHSVVPPYPEVCGPMFKEERIDLIAYTKDRESLPHMEGYPELKLRPDGPSFDKVRQHGVNDAPYAVMWINADGKQVRDKAYAVWTDMLRRVYTNRDPAYHDATVDVGWLSFMAFRAWYMDQDPKEGDQLDKDLLYPGNKHYGPDTCVFISPAVNTFIGSNDTAVNVKGYSYVPNRTKPYQARITITENGVSKSKNLGRYTTKEEAQLVYTKARDKQFQQHINEEKRPNVKEALEHHRKIMWNKLK